MDMPNNVELDIGCFGTGEDLSDSWTKTQQEFNITQPFVIKYQILNTKI